MKMMFGHRELPVFKSWGQNVFKRGLGALLLLAFSVTLMPTVNAADLDETLTYRLENAGFDRLGKQMCIDVFNGGPQNNQLDSRKCANYTGQFWKFNGTVTELRHLPTYSMTTVFRGDDMCLTINGTLIDHVLRLMPCTDPLKNNQIWIVLPVEGKGWEIVPYLEEISDKLAGFKLVVSAPPEGDGRPYIDTKDYVGKGYIWRLKPVDASFKILTPDEITLAKDVNAGPIWNNNDAKAKCPKVCSGLNLKWNGNWKTTVPGKMSVCGCD